jgi:hypothetical protein
MTKGYEKDSYYCPQCGQLTVWVEHGHGDYYLGPKFLCTSCSHLFYLPHMAEVKEENPTGGNDAEILAALKAAQE